MSLLLASARAVHFAATMWLFGELVLAWWLSAWQGSDAPAGPGEALRRRLPSVARWCIAIGIASAVAWLAAAAATMSDLPLSRAIEPSTFGAVVGDTLFGKVWIARLCLAVLLLLALWPRSAGRSGRRVAASTVVAGAYLVALAWTGHAAAAEGPWRGGEIVSDVMHLLAAGAWLGALPPLVHLLGRAQPISVAAWIARRFSVLGIACVSVLILSGIGNSWFLVGSVPALFGTRYGILLLAKLALLAAMLSFAAVNRLVLPPRLAAGDGQALRALRRNALLEIAAGLLVVAIVGMLGITVPAAHQSPLWPFAHTLSWAPARESTATLWALVAAVLVAAGGLAVLVAGARQRAWTRAGAGIVGVAAAAMMGAWLLTVPAYPTTYAASSVRYTTAAIGDGARLFAAHCATCHGGDGAGSAAGSVARAPNLVRHAANHRAGELYWWIAHGREGTPMPAFAPPLVSDEIWSIVQFLHTLSDAADFAGTDAGLLKRSPVPAPDFSFELPERGQETLLQPDSKEGTLLVLYSLPDSLPRLRSLASQRAFDDKRIRVLAISASATDAQTAGAQTPGGESVLAITASDVAMVYAMFAARDRAVASHAEFLIDRRGRLRARWLGVPAPGADRNREIFAAAQKLDSERPSPPPSPEHAH
ncbi:MAG TPA: copper homeostasis membrane protein CopD [Casimicrobiaceae bacterium]|nr:copper homeostasis membrane protein CopD [Casimicrobiaceae bacterium]